MRKNPLAPFTFFMHEQPSSTNSVPSSSEVFHRGFDEEFRKRNLFQAAIMRAWLERHPNQDEVAWVALFAEAFAREYALAGEALPQNAAQDDEFVRAWMRRLEEGETSLS